MAKRSAKKSFDDNKQVLFSYEFLGALLLGTLVCVVFMYTVRFSWIVWLLDALFRVFDSITDVIACPIFVLLDVCVSE